MKGDQLDSYAPKNEKDKEIQDDLKRDLLAGRISDTQAEGIFELYRRGVITFDDVREIRGQIAIDTKQTHDPDDPMVDKISKYITMDGEVKHWEEKVREETEKGEEGNKERVKAYKQFSDYCRLTADGLRLKVNVKRKYDISKEIMEESIENNEYTKLERFRKWLKKNGIAVFGFTAIIGGLVTAVVSLAKGVGREAGGAADSAAGFLKKFAKLAKKLGLVIEPIVSAAFNILAAFLKYTAKALSFLLNNLWLLFLFLAYILYEYLSKKYKNRNND